MTSIEETKRRLWAEIDRRRSELAQLCADCLKVPAENSPGNTTAIADHYTQILAKAGLPVERFEPKPGIVSLVSTQPGRSEHPRFVLNGHLALLEVLDEDYVRTARAKGIHEFRVIMKHGLRNALIPVITVVGLEFGRLLGGVVVVESVFAWPGLGRMLLEAIQARDFPVIQGSVLLFSVFLILTNFTIDLCYGIVDPRVRHAR